MKWLALLLIAACEREVSTTATSDPAPPPGPNRLDIDLPKAQHGGDVVSMLRVAVSATEVYVNGDRALTYSSSAGDWEYKVIAERLAKALPAPSASNTKVIIAADKRVAYGIVVAVIDGCKQRGYNAIALESTP